MSHCPALASTGSRQRSGQSRCPDHSPGFSRTRSSWTHRPDKDHAACYSGRSIWQEVSSSRDNFPNHFVGTPHVPPTTNHAKCCYSITCEVHTRLGTPRAYLNTHSALHQGSRWVDRRESDNGGIEQRRCGDLGSGENRACSPFIYGHFPRLRAGRRLVVGHFRLPDNSA